MWQSSSQSQCPVNRQKRGIKSLHSTRLTSTPLCCQVTDLIASPNKNQTSNKIRSFKCGSSTPYKGDHPQSCQTDLKNKPVSTETTPSNRHKWQICLWMTPEMYFQKYFKDLPRHSSPKHRQFWPLFQGDVYSSTDPKNITLPSLVHYVSETDCLSSFH